MKVPSGGPKGPRGVPCVPKGGLRVEGPIVPEARLTKAGFSYEEVRCRGIVDTL